MMPHPLASLRRSLARLFLVVALATTLALPTVAAFAADAEPEEDSIIVVVLQYVTGILIDPSGCTDNC
ncbi:MAG: hypothetical protein AAGN46_01760 [Acidobacteriota bacterium]